MSVHVDFDRRLVSAAVRDLVAPPERSRAGGITAQLRARLGRDVHAAYQQARESESSAFRSEVAVSTEISVGGFTATVRGRVDGVIDCGDELVIEEVKSVLVAGGQLHAVSIPSHYAAQVRLYAVCAARAGWAGTIRARLVFVSIIDGTRHGIDVPFHVDSATGELIALLGAAIDRAEAERARAARRAEAARHLVFPYARARPHQGALIDRIACGLDGGRPVAVSAPTGIGKTVSALLAALRFGLACNARVMFTTAKGTQRELVATTFADIVAASAPAASGLIAVTLRAKDRMCPPGHRLCHPDVCDHLRDFDRRAATSGAVADLLADGPHVTPEMIYERGSALRLCPFELSMEVADKAELVIGDYNHVYDRSHLISSDAAADRAEPARKQVVIIDEAHNLVDRARGYYSPFVGSDVLADIASRIRAGRLAAAGAIAESQLVIDGCARTATAPVFEAAVALFDELRSAIAALAPPDGGVDGCSRIRVEPAAWDLVAERAMAIMVGYAHYKHTHQLVVAGDELMALLHLIVRLRDLIAADRDELVAFVSVAVAGAARGAGIGVACLDPSRELAGSHRRALGTIAMSATLEPMRYFCDMLGLSELEPVTVAVGSPFPTGNRRVVIVPSVSTVYRHRWRCAPAIASLIDRIVAVRPGCYAAFFPSYEFMNHVRALLVVPHEQLLVQRRDMTEAARDGVLAALRGARGPRLLLGVTGGVFSEGVDLPGDALVGAIVVGPAMPRPDFERTQMRAYFDANGRDGFAYAMVYPGMHRVVQAAGRVIRTMNDRGIIALLGERFATPAYANCLPSDWYDRRPAELITSDPVAMIAEFWSLGDRTRANATSSR